MAGQPQRAPQKATAKSLAILKALLQGYHPRDFAVALWDGTRLPPGPGQFCRFTWKINNAGALRALLRSDRQVSLGEAYIYGDFDIEGDILSVFYLAQHLLEKQWSAREKLRLGTWLFTLPAHADHRDRIVELRGKAHSKTRDRQAIQFHYNLSNDFYQLWLDRTMTYSCAYFETPDDTLDEAQTQKLDYICRKLRLQPDERLLDIGCGWGGLILHAAQRYGAHAIGVTLSEQQLDYARARIREAALESRCEAHLLDYRDSKSLGHFDKVVSVGMVEHVGKTV
jgi:cyclopropane-fatty-acyl-phospholipid synthase